MECPNCNKENPEGAKFCLKCGSSLVQACPKCGASNPLSANYCGQCRTKLSLGQPQQAKHTRPPYLLPFVGAATLVCAIVTILVVWLITNPPHWWCDLTGICAAESPVPVASPPPLPTLTPAPPPGKAVTASANLTVTLPPPLANVEFPVEPIAYPSEWPENLRYPDSFSLVETSSGTLTEGAQGWAAKLRYNGDPAGAADLLASFFTAKGWQVVERTELDSGGFLILIQQEGKRNSGVIVIDPDTSEPGLTRVLVTVFP